MADTAQESAVVAPRLRVTEESVLVRRILIGVALAFFGLFLLLPLAVVFIEALGSGLQAYFAAITDPDALAAIKLTLLDRPDMRLVL